MSLHCFRSLWPIAMAILLLVLPSSAVSADDGKEDKKVQPPFFPSLINTHTGKPVTSSEFMSPDLCGGCHGEIFAQWKGSMHAHAFVDPVFQALWKIGAQETNGLTDKLCAGCHTAIGTVS